MTHQAVTGSMSSSGLPFGFGHAGSGMRCQVRSGLSSSHGTPEARSMAGQLRSGRASRAIQCRTAPGQTPMAEANALYPPAASIALMSASISVFDTNVTAAVNHICDLTPVFNPGVENLNTLAGRLKYARRKRGYRSQKALAEACGTVTSAIGNIEAGSRTGPATLITVVEVLAIPMRWLRDGEGPEPDWTLKAQAVLSARALEVAEIYDSIKDPKLADAAFAFMVAADRRGQEEDPEAYSDSQPMPLDAPIAALSRSK